MPTPEWIGTLYLSAGASWVWIAWGVVGRLGIFLYYFILL